MSEEPLYLYVIYDHPTDFPEKIVARMHIVMAGEHRPTTRLKIFDTLDQARIYMTSLGLSCLARDPSDDPKIVETWI